MKIKPFDIAVAVMFAAITFAVAFLSRSFGFAEKATEIAGGYGFHLIAAMCVFLVVIISFTGGTAIRQSLAVRGSRGMRMTAAERKKLCGENPGAYFRKIRRSYYSRLFAYVILLLFCAYCWLFFSVYLFKNVVSFFICIVPVVFSVYPFYRMVSVPKSGETIPEEIVLNGAAYPSFCDLTERAKEKAGYRGKVVVYATPEFGTFSEKTHGEIRIGLGLLLVELLSEEEICALIAREIVYETDKKVRKVVFYMEKFSLAPQFGFSFFRNLFAVTNASVRPDEYPDRGILEYEAERVTDERIARTELASAFACSLKKFELAIKYRNDERCDYRMLEYETDGSVNPYYFSKYRERFLLAYEKYGRQWQEEILKRCASEFETTPPYSVRIRTLGTGEPTVSFLGRRPEEIGMIEGKFDRLFAEMMRANEQGIVEYEEMKRVKIRYETHPEEFKERFDLLSVAGAYRASAEPEKAEEIYRELVGRGDDSYELAFEYGTLLLSMRNDEGLTYLRRAMENANYTERVAEYVSGYLRAMGRTQELATFRDEYYKKQSENAQNGELSLKRGFSSSTFPQEDLKTVIARAGEDDNVTELYAADGKTDSGKVIYVFAFRVRNKEEDAVGESFGKLFSLLDNEFGDYETYLIPLDKQEFYVKKLNQVKNALVYERK